MAQDHVLLTARLRLRPVSGDDEQAVVATLNDFEVTRWLRTVPFPYEANDFDHFLDAIAIDGGDFVIEDTAGFCGLIGLDEGRELGYWLAPHAQGKGYATEAAEAVLSAAFDGLGTPVQAGYFVGNLRSARVLQKLGFVETGRSIERCRAQDTDLPHVTLILEKAGFHAARKAALHEMAGRLPLIRDAVEADLSALRDIYNHALLHTTAIWNDDVVDVENRRAWFQARAAQGYPILVADLDGQIAGYASFGDFRVQDGFRATVENSIYVTPEAQGRGVAKALMTVLVERARACGKHVMIAAVHDENTASMQLHQALGFRATGVLHEAGQKFGSWVNLAFLELRLDDRPHPAT